MLLQFFSLKLEIVATQTPHLSILTLLFLRWTNMSIIEFKDRTACDAKYCTANKFRVTSRAKINATQFSLRFRGLIRFTNRRSFEVYEKCRGRITYQTFLLKRRTYKSDKCLNLFAVVLDYALHSFTIRLHLLPT